MHLNPTLKAASLLLALGPITNVHAQNWIVGDPVDMLLYSHTSYGGCTPVPDQTFTLEPSPVTGVGYKAIITAIDPPTGSVSILPGLSNGVVGSGLAIDTAVERSILLAPGTTSAVIEFRAMGTPTTAGEAHPCTASPFWLSNLMLCPEGLIPVINNACTVQLGTGVDAGSGLDPRIQWPTVTNGQELVMHLPSMAPGTVRVFDVNGRVVARRDITGQGTISLVGERDGIYVLSVSGPDGQTSVQRFALVH